MPDARVGGHALYYEDHGEPGHGPVPGPGAAEALVLVHGDYECTRYWAAQIDFFAPHYRVVAYDRWGYGRSSPRDGLPPDFYDEDATDLVALLDHLDIDRAHLVGHSGGGTTALLAAARHPGRARSVVTAGAHAYVEGVTLAYLDEFRRALGEPDGSIRRAGEACHGARWREVADQFLARWLDPAWRGWTIMPALAGVRCPALLLLGTRDGTATPAQLAAMAAAVPGARALLVEGAGHVIHRRHAAEFNRLVGEFLLSAAGR